MLRRCLSFEFLIVIVKLIFNLVPFCFAVNIITYIILVCLPKIPDNHKLIFGKQQHPSETVRAIAAGMSKSASLSIIVYLPETGTGFSTSIARPATVLQVRAESRGATSGTAHGTSRMMRAVAAFVHVLNSMQSQES